MKNQKFVVVFKFLFFFPIFVWFTFINVSHAQLIESTPSVDNPPESQHDYGQWLDKQAKNQKEIGTPAALYKLSPMPDSPTNLKIEAGNGLALLKWDKMPNAIAYLIYISNDGKTFKKRFKKPVKTTKIEIGLLENDQTYYFGITSIAHYGKESKMAVQTVTPRKGLRFKE